MINNQAIQLTPIETKIKNLQITLQVNMRDKIALIKIKRERL